MMDSETLKNLLPSLFQAQSANTNTRRKAKRASSSQMEKRVYIDVAKLDEISGLSSDDKHTIKNILSLIKCESESQKVVSTKAKPKKKKVRSFKRVTKSYARENLAVPLGPVTSSKGRNKCMSNISKTRGHRKCPDCKETPRVRRVSNSRASPNHSKSPNVAKVKLAGLNTSSQEKLLQALINLDNSGSYGDTLNGQPECARQPNRINISNFKVKYVSPTYVVQYNGEDKAPELPEKGGFYSNVALESHLGQRPALSVRDDRKDRQSMHYEDSKPYIVGVGAVPEQMLRERSDSRQASPGDETARSERSPWQRESIPGYPKPPPPESPPPPASPPSASSATADAPSAKGSRCQRLLGFVRRVLCGEAETPRPPKKGDKPKRKVTISDEVKIETPCVRTTKSQFFRIGQNK